MNVILWIFKSKEELQTIEDESMEEKQESELMRPQGDILHCSPRRPLSQEVEGSAFSPFKIK